MTVKVPDVGERNLLGELNNSWGDTLRLHLFKNNYTPVDASVLGDFTEANFSGYADYSLANPTVDGAPDAGGRAFQTWDDVVFTHDGGATANTCYGYYVTDVSGTKLMWAERFANPITFGVLDDAVTITPKLTLKSEN